VSAPALAEAPPRTRRGPAPASTGPTVDSATTKQLSPHEPTTGLREPRTATPRPEVWAQVTVVAGRTRPRALLVVHCSYCGARHVHHAAPDVVATVRKASCGHGSYRVHAAVLREVA
jgi:hypothetical protein